MGDAGSPLPRLRRALLTGNMTIIDAAAREVPSVSLEDALRILVVMADKRDPRYDRAAARWTARVISERRLDLAQGRRVLALVDVLPRAPEAIVLTLRDLCREPRGAAPPGAT